MPKKTIKFLNSNIIINKITSYSEEILDCMPDTIFVKIYCNTDVIARGSFCPNCLGTNGSTEQYNKFKKELLKNI